jgi:hypothetical protein
MFTPRGHRFSHRSARGWAGWLALVLATIVATPALAQQPRELLNSERIAAKFGSYGLEVLSQDDRLRVSNLFSTDAGGRTCRTFALVRYPPAIDPALAAPHAEIVAGGSIGAVFAAQGWEVRKTHLHYGDTEASARLTKLMSVEPGTPLAEHIYVLDVVKDGRVLEYAALVEIHHPDYLQRSDLEDIYGAPDTASRRELVAELIATAAVRSR